jgi:hypothetical protein
MLGKSKFLSLGVFNYMKRIMTMVLLSALIALGMATSAGATTWIGGATGDWSTGTNWDFGEPTSVDDAFINFGTGSITLPGEQVKKLTLGQSLGQSGRIEMTSGDLSAARETLGGSGRGTFDHSGGINTVSFELLLGETLTGEGTYNLFGGDLSADIETIGSAGTGTFTQNSGTNTVSNGLVLGFQSTGTGRYNLNGGDLSAVFEAIGSSGTGIFSQTAGTNTVSSALGVNGSYILLGGSLSAGSETVGGTDSGTLTHWGGTNTVINELRLGSNGPAIGLYNLFGGDLSAGSETIGFVGTGALTQNAGTNTISGELALGRNASGTGTYNLNSGSLSAGSETIGGSGTGTFTQDSGTNTVSASLSLGKTLTGEGTYNLFSGNLSANSEIIGAFGAGTFTQWGGTNTIAASLRIASQPGSAGNYDLKGGTLTAGTVQLNTGGTFTQTGGALNTVTFNQAGGTVNGTLQNQGTFRYISGAFNGRLLNQGTVNFDNDFTAGDGVKNQADLNIASGRTVTLNGLGLDNDLGSTISLLGTLGGSGPLRNFGNINVTDGTVTGFAGGFANHGQVTLNAGDFTLSNLGTNTNYGDINLASGLLLNLVGASLTNNGTLNLNGGSVTGSGILNNSFGGTIQGQGTIDTNFNNSLGTLLVGAGTTDVVQASANSGVIQLASASSNLTGGTISNSGIIQGLGTVNNEIAGLPGSTITAEGAFTLGDAGSYTGFNSQGTLNVGAHAVELKSKSFAGLGARTTLAGGTLQADNGIALGAGGVLEGSGNVNARVAAGFGSTINASGNLTLGDAGSVAGFSSDGELYTNAQTVTINDANVAVLGSLTQLGDGVSGGTLQAGSANPVDTAPHLFVEEGKNLLGRGNVIGNVKNNGAAIGDGTALNERLVFDSPWIVSGKGTFENTLVLGTFAPGESPAVINGTNQAFGGTIEIELGGLLPGFGNDNHDQINDLATILLFSEPTLSILSLNSFAPEPGDAFTIMTWETGLQGMFGDVQVDPFFTDSNIRFDLVFANLSGSGNLTLVASAVPIPASVWLLGSALAGFLVRKREV